MRILVLIAISIILFFPIYWMVIYSFTQTEAVMALPPLLIPLYPTLENYEYLFNNMEIADWLVNTAIVLSCTIVVTLLVVSLAAYALSVFDYKINKVLFWILMGAIIVPGQSLFISKFVTVRSLGLWGSYWSVILNYGFSAVYTFIFKTYIDTIPKSLRDSAIMDGAGEFRILLDIYYPICFPVMAGITLFISITVLNDYFWQLLMLQFSNKQTLVVGVINKIMKHVQTEILKNSIGLKLAGGVIILVPTLAIFLLLQKYFKKGLIVGSLKE